MNHRSWWLLPLLLLLGFGLAGLQPVQAASGKWYRDNGNMMGSETAERPNLCQNNRSSPNCRDHRHVLA